MTITVRFACTKQYISRPLALSPELTTVINAVYTQHQPILIQVFSFICRKTYVEFTYYNCIVMSCCPCITDVGKSGKGKDEGRRLPASERLPWIKRGLNHNK